MYKRGMVNVYKDYKKIIIKNSISLSADKKCS